MLTAAAPVSYPVANGGFWHFVRLSWVAASLACAVAWMAWHVGLAPAQQGLLAAAAMMLLLGVDRRRPTPVGVRLQWTGDQWRLDGQEQAWRVRVGLDLGPWMLVKATSASPVSTRWLPLSAGDAPAAWSRLRQALYVAPGAGSGGSGELPAGAAP